MTEGPQTATMMSKGLRETKSTPDTVVEDEASLSQTSLQPVNITTQSEFQPHQHNGSLLHDEKESIPQHHQTKNAISPMHSDPRSGSLLLRVPETKVLSALQSLMDASLTVESRHDVLVHVSWRDGESVRLRHTVPRTYLDGIITQLRQREQEHQSSPLAARALAPHTAQLPDPDSFSWYGWQKMLELIQEWINAFSLLVSQVKSRVRSFFRQVLRRFPARPSTRWDRCRRVLSFLLLGTAVVLLVAGLSRTPRFSRGEQLRLPQNRPKGLQLTHGQQPLVSAHRQRFCHLAAAQLRGKRSPTSVS